MSKRALLHLTFAAAALAPALPQAQVYFWRDAHNIANYAGLCPVGISCGVKPIRLVNNAFVGSAAGSGSTSNTIIASNTPEISTAPMNLAGLGSGGAASAPGSGSSGAIGGGAGGGGSVTSASASLLTPTIAPAASTPSTPAPSTPSAAQPVLAAPSDVQPTVTAANTPPVSSTSSQLRSPIGTNLDAITYWSPQLPFVNVMKSASGWGSNDGKPLDLDQNGWVRSLGPGQTAHALTTREIDGGRYPPGRYTVRYKGQGQLSLRFDAKVVSEKPGELLIDVAPSITGDGIWIEIESTNPANYVRDIEIIMPGGICQGDPFTHVTSPSDCGARPFLPFVNNPDIVFYPVFANRLRGYSVLRFMDWMMTNNSMVTSWDERTPVSANTWATTNGAPPEIIIALANLIGAHPWLTVPHQADDAYVQNLALLVKARLNPALSVYVEHSNEIWNSMFSQWRYVNAQGAAQTPQIDGLQYHALRTRAIGQIFKSVLGASRVITVLGAQAANPWTASRALDYLKNRLGTSSPLGIDAVAIAPYIIVMPNPNDAAKYTSMTMDQLFAYARASALPESVKWMSGYRALAAMYGVHLISYEGGQHLVGVAGAENNEALTTLFNDFNRDPRIKQLYLDYLTYWKKTGGELFVHYNDVSRYSKWGRWGALEYIAQTRADAPKFDALQTFIEQNPVWWPQ